jgi:hypothetical protein
MFAAFGAADGLDEAADVATGAEEAADGALLLELLRQRAREPRRPQPPRRRCGPGTALPGKRARLNSFVLAHWEVG